MKELLSNNLLGQLVPFIACSILLVSCSQIDSSNQIDKSSNPTPTIIFSESPISTFQASATPHPSFLVFDHLSGDAGNYYVLAGETITITWENAPAGAYQYEFRLVPENGESPQVLGNDLNAVDGVSVSWTIPEHLAAELQATAIFPDGKKVELSFPPMLYSGDFPPEGECSILALNQPVEVYRQPHRTSQVFALLSPGVYARVLEIAPNGWYRIDASVAEINSSSQGNLHDNNSQDFAISLWKSPDPSPASGEGWIKGDKGILLIGGCPVEKRIVYYYFVTIADYPIPDGSVVVMKDTYILAPTLSDIPLSQDTTADLKHALQAVLNDSRNGWESSNLEIIDVTFEDDHAAVVLQGDYFGVGDVTLITARMQILLTVFANPAVQFATVTLNGDTIGNLGVSNSMSAKPADYVFPRSEIENYISENAYQSP